MFRSDKRPSLKNELLCFRMILKINADTSQCMFCLEYYIEYSLLNGCDGFQNNTDLWQQTLWLLEKKNIRLAQIFHSFKCVLHEK